MTLAVGIAELRIFFLELPGGVIAGRNIVFRNISCTGKFVNPSLFEGYDKDRKVEDILFENIVLNGKRVTSPDELNINKREFVDKMHIK